MTWNAALRASEFWTAIVVALVGVFTKFGLIPADQVALFEPYIKIAITYIVLRLTGKTAKAVVPPNGPIPLKPVAGLIVAIILLAFVWAVPVHAQEAPVDVSLADVQRVSLGLNVGGEWNASDPVPTLENTPFVGVTGTYVLTTHIALALPVSYGIQTQVGRAQPEARWRFDSGSSSLALTFGYELYAGGDELPQWRAGVVWARPLWKELVLGFAGGVGLAEQDFESRLMLAYPLFKGKDS